MTTTSIETDVKASTEESTVTSSAEIERLHDDDDDDDKKKKHDDDNIKKKQRRQKQHQQRKRGHQNSDDDVVLDDLQSHLSIAAKEFENELLKQQQAKSNWKASAVGGMMSLAQDFAVMAVTNNNNNKNKHKTSGNNVNIWDKAINAAKVSGEIHEAERKFDPDQISIEYLVGSPTKNKNIGFVIHGFMTADEDEDIVKEQWIEWSNILDVVLYRIIWPAGSVKDWKQFVNKSTVGMNNNKNNKNQIKDMVLSSSEQLLSSPSSSSGTNDNRNNKNNNPSSNWISQLTSNPWNVAQDKTVHIGGVLAKFFSSDRRPGSFQKFTNVSLIGHSLGGAIIYQTLKQYTTFKVENNVTIDNAIILGGAFVIDGGGKNNSNSNNTKETIANILKPIRKKIINVYSRNDQVLQIIFRAANMNLHHEAAGTMPILITNQIVDSNIRTKWFDLDATSQIPVNEKTYQGHSYEYIIPWIATTLKDILT